MQIVLRFEQHNRALSAPGKVCLQFHVPSWASSKGHIYRQSNAVNLDYIPKISGFVKTGTASRSAVQSGGNRKTDDVTSGLDSVLGGFDRDFVLAADSIPYLATREDNMLDHRHSRAAQHLSTSASLDVALADVTHARLKFLPATSSMTLFHTAEQARTVAAIRSYTFISEPGYQMVRGDFYRSCAARL
jgi:hypothetical protein